VAVEGPVARLSDADTGVAGEVAAELRSAAVTLSAEIPGDEIADCLMRWGIVLAILGADVLDGVATLLMAGNQRAANIAARSIADYNVRLRYYFVQSRQHLAKLAIRPDQRKRIVKRIHALRDWKNSGAKHAGILNQYDPSTWPEDVREKILSAVAKGEAAVDSRFSVMCRYLENNEVKERQVLPILRHRFDWRYKHYLPAWAMQSSFSHGDQVIVSDVIDFSNEGEPTGSIHIAPPYDAGRTILFTALEHGLELLRSMAFVRPVGWVMNHAALQKKVGTVFLARDRE
jgi:hypothetical protein